ncbi:TPA: hypothetical protein JAJ38_001164 [Legionella pneumophila]|nr:hypothetical protein [Legionella pneumophila]
MNDSLYFNYFLLKSWIKIIIKQSHWFILACCLLLAVCTNSGAANDSTKN